MILTFRHGRLVQVSVNNGVVLLLGAVLLLILALLQLRQGRDDSYAQADLYIMVKCVCVCHEKVTNYGKTIF